MWTTPAAQELLYSDGLAFNEARTGQSVNGIYRRSVMVGDSKFAVIEKSREFTLVPWRPVLERAVGRPVSGIMREGGVPATFLWGGATRSEQPMRVRLFHGDVVVWGGPARLTFHGVETLRGSGSLTDEYRYNLTFRAAR